MFSATVPNTYASTVASLRAGWGGARDQEPKKLEWVKGCTDHCDCGRVKKIRRASCERCSALDDLPAGVPGDVLRVLADYESMTIREIADLAQRNIRNLRRVLPELIASGRVSTWLQDRDPYDVPEELRKTGAAARFNRQVLPPMRMYKRVW